jgi:uncharacterized caspase-like protein
MKRKTPWFQFLQCAVLWGLCLGPIAAQQPERAVTVKPVAVGERRIALVIGNSAYTVGPLKNPTNDAEDMAAKLSALGFAVEKAVNADKQQMKALVRAFGVKARTSHIALFFFAGHGMQVKGRNFLIPIGATINNEADVEEEAIDANFVLAQLEDNGQCTNIVLLDACRNNPLGRSFRAEQKGLASMDAPSGSLIGYATQPGNVASDGAGRNGVYTGELLNQLGLAGLSLMDMMIRTRNGVMGKTGKQQVPWEAVSLTGNVYLNGAPANAPLAALSPDAELWLTIRDSRNAKDFQDYLQRFPHGQYVEAATVKLRDLAVVAAAADALEAAGTRQHWGRITSQTAQLAGKSGWVNTGVEVQAGDRLELQASGQITLGDIGIAGPEGIAGNEAFQVVSACPVGALLVRVAGGASHCARGQFINLTQTGALHLGLNDNRLRDNAGQFTVTVTVHRLVRGN